MDEIPDWIRWVTLLIKNPNIHFRELVIKPVEDDGLVPKDWINSAVRYSSLLHITTSFRPSPR